MRQQDLPDLVLLDSDMPGMTGFEAVMMMISAGFFFRYVEYLGDFFFHLFPPKVKIYDVVQVMSSFQVRYLQGSLGIFFRLPWAIPRFWACFRVVLQGSSLFGLGFVKKSFEKSPIDGSVLVLENSGTPQNRW